MNFKKIFFILLLIFSCSFLFLKSDSKPSALTVNEDTNLTPDAKSACLIEVKTNTLLYTKNAHEKLAPASMTKIMTMLLVMEKIANNQISLSDMVTTPKEASSLGGSQIYLSEGEQMSVHDLLKSMCIASANDAAMSLAIYVAGSETNFVKMMNDKVKQLKLENTNFVNPYGFDDPNHYTSSYDIACIASHLINNYPKVLEYTSTYEDYVREDTTKRFWLVNTNKLVKFVDGVDGLKTGWTEKSGYCLTATITKNNERFIAVAMGNTTPSVRNKEVTSLLNYGINNFETKTILEKDQVIKQIKDYGTTPKNISLITKQNVIIVKNKNEPLLDINLIEHIDLKNNEFYIDVYYGENLYSRVLLTPTVEIKKANLFEIFFEILKEIFLITK